MPYTVSVVALTHQCVFVQIQTIDAHTVWSSVPDYQLDCIPFFIRHGGRSRRVPADARAMQRALGRIERRRIDRRNGKILFVAALQIHEFVIFL
jgi:hypothetical protein